MAVGMEAIEAQSPDEDPLGRRSPTTGDRADERSATAKEVGVARIATRSSPGIGVPSTTMRSATRYEGRDCAARYRDQIHPRGAGEPAGGLRAPRRRRGVAGGRAYFPPYLEGKLLQPRADPPPATAATTSRRLRQLAHQTGTRGYTIIPLRLVLQAGPGQGRAGRRSRGSASYEKRQTLADREAQREMDRAIRSHGRG